MPRAISKLVVWALVIAHGPAAADPRFEEYGATVAKRATTQLAERACDLDLQFTAGLVTAEVRQRIHNPGPGALAASYELTIPRGAAVTGFAIQGDGPVAHATSVAATAPTSLVEARDVLDVDPGMISALEVGDAPRYRMLLQPIEPAREVLVTTRWAMRAEVRDGALRVVLPGRAATTKLAACRGTIRATPGPGATVGRIRVAGQETGARGVATFTLDASELAIDVELAFARREPLVWTQTEALGNGWHATVVSILAPPSRAAPVVARRALFVVDGSRSMELVGRAHAARVLRAITGVLPANTEVDAIVYDRHATRTFGAWRPVTPANVGALEAAITQRAPGNGSDLAGAFRLAHQAIADGARDSTMVIVITDGMLGEDADLIAALAGKPSALDVHVIALDPARATAPDTARLRRPVSFYGGSFVEVGVGELDGALAGVETWLRPSWVEVQLTGSALEIPPQLRAGSGASYALVHQGAVPRLVLRATSETAVAVAARATPGAAAAIVLAATDVTAFYPRATDEPSDPVRARAQQLRATAERAHATVTLDRALAVLATRGRVAASRRAMLEGGGPYTRVVAVADPAFATVAPGAQTAPVASAIAKLTLERMFRDQLQPKAYVCYQRALGLAPKLAGTAQFTFHMARGEVTHVSLGGLGDAKFDACLLDAAYLLTPPLPDFAINADDQTVAHYGLTFNLHDSRPLVVLGDADSESPLDIDAIKGGVPTRRSPVTVDATTPLGGMRPR